MQATFKLSDILEFILKGKLFKSWKYLEILNCLVECLDSGGLLWMAEDGKIASVLVARIDHDKKHVHVIGIEGKLKPFIKRYRNDYKDYTLSGYRDGKLVNYNL